MADEMTESQKSVGEEIVKSETTGPADDETSPDGAADEAAPDTSADEAAPDKSTGEAAPDSSDDAPEDEDDGLEEPEDPLIRPVPDDGIRRRWYAVHAHSGQEANVRKSLMVLAEQTGLDKLLTNVLVPMEEVAEFKSGEKKISKRKYFPGYVLVQLPEHPEKNPDLWHLVKDTPGVTGFIGSRNEPVPLEDGEVNAIVEEIRGERERPKPKISFESGERVKIIDGPFSNFLGNIDDINEERGNLRVMVEIFERLTSVEVEFWQVEKI